MGFEFCGLFHEELLYASLWWKKPSNTCWHTLPLQNPESSAEFCLARFEADVDIKYSEIDNDIFHE